MRLALGAAPAVSLGSLAPAEAAPVQAAPTGPRFFTPAEHAFIVAAVDRLIPKDAEGPGAVELNVPDFIDRQMETPYGKGATWYLQGPFDPAASRDFGFQGQATPQSLYRQGIAAVDTLCQQRHQKAFAALDGKVQDQILGELESGAVALDGVDPFYFFHQLLQNTREGYFSDPIHGGNRGMASWKMVGFPGARADFMDWVDQYKPYPLPPVSINGRG